jgi:hypothetical protein
MVMKKSLISFGFAVVMVLSMAFIGGIASDNNPFSAKAQTVTVKKKKVGAIRSAYRGGKYIGKQVWTGTRWVGVKTYQGSKYVAGKTWKGTKYVGKKTAKGAKWVGRKVY